MKKIKQVIAMLMEFNPNADSFSEDFLDDWMSVLEENVEKRKLNPSGHTCKCGGHCGKNKL